MIRLLYATLAGCLFQVLVEAATFTVTTLDDSGSNSLRQAILDANTSPDDDSINIVARGKIVLDSSLPSVTGNVSVLGPGKDLLFISASNRWRVLTVSAGTTATVARLTIGDGFVATGNGAGISNAGSLTLRDCVLMNHECASGNGGAVFNVGSLLITGSTLSHNDARSGGAILNTSNLTISGSSLVWNTAWYYDGGAISTLGGLVLLTNSTVASNRAVGYGFGGVSGTASGGDAAGGGIHAVTGAVMIVNCALFRNSASGGDGADNWSGLPNNNPGSGGDGSGGALFFDGQTLLLVNTTISGNTAAGGRGGDGSVPCRLLGRGGEGYGGGLYTRGGTVNAESCTISGNLSVGGKGGSDELCVDNICGCSYYLSGAGYGGGIEDKADELHCRNTLVALNQTWADTRSFPYGGPDVSGWGGDTNASLGFNLIGNTNGLWSWTASDLVNVSPGLGPLQDNGGPVWTHALQAGSPAIDAGTNGGLQTDARGRPRTSDNPAIPNAPGSDGTDIGALEVEDILRAVAVDRDAADLLIGFTSESDKTYSVQYRNEVDSGAWTALPGFIRGTGGVVTYTNAGAATRPRGFYRIVRP